MFRIGAPPTRWYGPAMGGWLRWRDGLALAVVAAAAIAGAVAWFDGRVHIGLEVQEVELTEVTAEFGPDSDIGPSVVVVSSVVPDGNAVRYGIHPGIPVLDLWTTDGSEVERSEARFVSDFDELLQIPREAVATERIGGVTVGHFWEDPVGHLGAYPQAQIDRAWLEGRLRTDVYLPILGVGAGIAILLLLRRGLAGSIGRQEAVTAACAVAAPFLLAPVIDVGNPIGIVLAYTLLIAISLLMGIGLAVTHPEATYRRMGVGVAVSAVAIACLMVATHMGTPLLSPDERGPMFAAMGLVAFAPSAAASLSPARSARDRMTLLTAGLIPFAASTLLLPSQYIPPLPLLLVGGLVGWHLAPWGKVISAVGASFDRVRSTASSAADSGVTTSVMRERRDVVTGVVAAVAVLVCVAADGANAWALVVAALTAGAVALGVRNGVLGPDWTDAAVPLAAAVGIPVLMVPLTWSWPGLYPPLVLAPALAVLSVAHLLAERHSDPLWRWRLFVGAALVALLAVIAGSGGGGLAVGLLGLVCLVPGVPVAFTQRPGADAISWRLETLAVALTPAAAATVLLPGGTGVLVLGGWLAVVVVWRYLAIVPLVGMANRTQLQRDLAVAAAEAERARLAADLHDDALQQLTLLVRTLDDKGHADEANEAREIAAKLRAVVGDLRLPLLDDLGAGAALEWLVERVEPLAGGRVTLERSDLARPPADVELAVFRVAQEALTNAIKHGRPPIAVRYDVRADGRVSLAIDDAGAGIEKGAAQEPPGEGHFGLANMEQRAEQIGALLDVRRWPSGGTRVALDWRPG
jgi:signal transduction histidine kinase